MGLIIVLLVLLINSSNENNIKKTYTIQPYSLSRQSLNSNQFLTLNNIEPFNNKEYITREQCVKSVTNTCDRLADKDGKIKVSNLPSFYKNNTEEEEYNNDNYNFNNTNEEESCKPCS